MSDTELPPSPVLPAGTPPAEQPPALPAPRVVRKNALRLSLVWLVPIVALVLGAGLVVQRLLSVGPSVAIDFRTAEGLEAGKTEVRYKEVVVGRVEAVMLKPDRQRVRVQVRLERSAAGLAVDDSAFWVVRPRIGTAGISGLGTLLSGAYIAVDAGTSDTSRSEFTGLEAPPFVLRGEPGSSFVLRADDLGSLDVGSPVLYRRTRVGRVVGYNLDAVKDELQVKIFIDSPYERLVTQVSRFWNVSGIDVTLNASGLKLNTQSLATVIAGGVAFERAPDAPLPAAGGRDAPAPPGTRFQLFNDQRAALAPPDGAPLPVRMVFNQSIRGLAVGAPIDFLGVEIGSVRAIELQYDTPRQRFPVVVLADIYPLRVGAVRNTLLATLPKGVDGGGEGSNADARALQLLVKNGLRAQLRTGNLITNQLYVAFDFIPPVAGGGASAAAGPRQPGVALAGALVAGAVEVPTVAGTLSELQPQIADIVAKLSKVPFDTIGRDVQGVLGQAERAIGQLTPEAQQALAEVKRTLQSVQTTLNGVQGSLQSTLGAAQGSLQRLDRNLLDENAPVQRNLEQTMLELQRAAQSLRVLTDYLQRHPESVIRGKPADPPVFAAEPAGAAAPASAPKGSR